jgi:hypothetical protein
MVRSAVNEVAEAEDDPPTEPPVLAASAAPTTVDGEVGAGDDAGATALLVAPPAALLPAPQPVSTPATANSVPETTIFRSRIGTYLRSRNTG